MNLAEKEGSSALYTYQPIWDKKNCQAVRNNYPMIETFKNQKRVIDNRPYG